jgi:hypothetical protein
MTIFLQFINTDFHLELQNESVHVKFSITAFEQIRVINFYMQSETALLSVLHVSTDELTTWDSSVIEVTDHRLDDRTSVSGSGRDLSVI